MRAATTTPAMSMAEHWDELVTTAMLGTDRRDPPVPTGPLADLIDDALHPTPSERMLDHVAACTAVRRAGVLPGPPVDRLHGPSADERPVCVPAAVDRWHHITVSWPVLEDEWTLALIGNGWRIAPELVPAVLARHRSDPVRRARAELASGPLAGWLVAHLPSLEARAGRVTVSDEELRRLPELPIPSALQSLMAMPGPAAATSLVAMLDGGVLVHAHRAVVVNLIARMRPDALAPIAAALDSVDPYSPGHGLASVVADLATTRHRMLDELSRG